MMNLDMCAVPACTLGLLNRAVKWPAMRSCDTVVMIAGKSTCGWREGVVCFDCGADDGDRDSAGSWKWRKVAISWSRVPPYSCCARVGCAMWFRSR
jgi:hypothetical protein